MSNLAESLLGQAELTKPLDTQQTEGMTMKYLKKGEQAKDQIALRKGFDEIKVTFFEKFSPRHLQLPCKCEIIKLSVKHLLIIGSNNKNSEIAILNLRDYSSKVIKLGLGSLNNLKISSDESLIFIGTSTGLLVKYDFPSFSEDSKEIFQIGEEFISLDHFSNATSSILYAADWYSLNLLRIDLATKDQKAIARHEYTNAIRISADEKYFALSSYGKVTVYSREFKWKMMEINMKNIDFQKEFDSNDIESLIEFSHHGEKLAISYYTHIQIWNLEDRVLLKTFKLDTENVISSLKFTNDDEYLVAVGVDHSINIWELTSPSVIPKFINKPIQEYDQNKDLHFSNSEFSLEIDADDNCIYTHQYYTRNIYQWKAIFLDKRLYPESDFCKDGQRILIFRKKEHLIVSNVKDLEFYVWGIKSQVLLHTIKLGSPIWDFTFDSNESYLYVGSTENIFKIDSNTYDVVETIQNQWAGTISNIKVNETLIFSGGSSCSIVVQTLAGILKTEIKKHESEISAMKIHEKLLITGDFEGAMYIHLIDSWEEYAKLHMHSGWVRAINILNNGDTLITIARDRKCIFWSIYDKTVIKAQKINGFVDSCYLSNDEKNLITSTLDGEIKVYNLPSFESIIVKKFKGVEYQKFAMDIDENCMIVSNSHGIFRITSPLSKNNPEVVDEKINIPEIKGFLKGKRKQLSKLNDSWIIAPAMVNSLHYYSHENSKTSLKSALSLNSKYLNSSLGTPLDISLLKGNTEATGAIISQLKRRVKLNHFSLETISDCLVKLNIGGFKGLDALYNNCLISAPQQDLPDSCGDDVSLPIVNYALTMRIHLEDFIQTVSETDTKRIQFLISTVRINLEIGSSESIKFLESLLKCSNSDIFKTKFIQTILYNKWANVKWIIFSISALVILYLVLLSLYVVTRSPSILLAGLFINIILFAYEMFQIYIDPLEYIQDPWNYIDMSRAGLFYAYFFYAYILDHPISWILITVTMLSWIRGITLFTLSTKTRYMISLLGEVLKDMISFALIMFYSIAAFAFMKVSLSDGISGDAWTQLKSIVDLIIESYFETIGNFDTDNTGIEQLLVIVNTIFNFIIMMNLLISILGSTYDRVNDESLVEDLKQLTELIIEAESLLFSRRDNKTKRIMQICEEYTPPEVVGTDDMRQKFRTVKMDINNLKKENEELHKTAIQSIQSVIKTQLETNAKNDANKNDIINELKNTIDHLKRHMNASLQKDDEAIESEPNPYMCLKGHNLIKKIAEEKYCNICYTIMNKTQSMCCFICDFDMCLTCAQLYADHSPGKMHLKCNEDHSMLYFTDKKDLFNINNYENQTCRFCNKVIEDEIYHCIPCMFSVCGRCKTLNDKAFLVKEKTLCEKGHQLKWRHRVLYSKESFVQNCSTCHEYRSGAGFFNCLECPSYWCLDCFNKQFISKDADDYRDTLRSNSSSIDHKQMKSDEESLGEDSDMDYLEKKSDERESPQDDSFNKEDFNEDSPVN